MASNHHLQRTSQYRDVDRTATPDMEDEVTIDLGEVWSLIKKHIWMLIGATVVGAVVAGGLTWALRTATPDMEDEVTIDLGEVWSLIKKHIWMLIGATVVGAVVAGGLTWALIPKTYAASGTLFLTPRVQEGEIDINSLNSNQKLVNNVINLLTQDNIMSMVARKGKSTSTP